MRYMFCVCVCVSTVYTGVGISVRVCVSIRRNLCGLNTVLAQCYIGPPSIMKWYATLSHFDFKTSIDVPLSAEYFSVYSYPPRGHGLPSLWVSHSSLIQLLFLTKIYNVQVGYEQNIR